MSWGDTDRCSYNEQTSGDMDKHTLGIMKKIRHNIKVLVIMACSLNINEWYGIVQEDNSYTLCL